MRFTILILGDFLSLPHNTIGFSDEQCSVKLYKFEHNDFMAKQILVVKFYAMRQKKLLIYFLTARNQTLRDPQRFH